MSISTTSKILWWIIYIHAKIFPNFLVVIQVNSCAWDIFSQKQSFLENELICLRGSGGTDIDALDLDDYTLYQALHFFAELGVRGTP